MVMSHAVTNAPWQSSQTEESQWQVPAGAAGVEMIQGLSKARDPSGSVSSCRKKITDNRVREGKTRSSHN